MPFRFFLLDDPQLHYNIGRMTAHILHVLESKSPAPGSVAVCLPGLIDALKESAIDGSLVDEPRELDAHWSGSQAVHIHGWNYPLALHAARRAKQSGKPYIISPLGQLTPSAFNRSGFGERLRGFFAQRPMERGAAAITALNDMDYQALCAAKAHSNIVLLPYGIGFRDFEKLPAAATGSGTHRKLLMLGPLDPVFGCVVLLKAFAELGLIDDGWTVTLAGADRGNWRSKLEAAVRRKGGENRVTFKEAKTLDDQRNLLKEATVLVAPSLHVSPAVSIMQALAAGVPVVATQNAAPPGLNGALRVCGPSRDEVREALRSMMEEPPSRRQELAHAARKKARNSFDWSVLAPRYAELYTACVRN